MRFIFQNHLEIEANDNFQVPTEMEVDHNQESCGNPNEIRSPEKIEIKIANQVSIFETYISKNIVNTYVNLPQVICKPHCRNGSVYRAYICLGINTTKGGNIKNLTEALLAPSTRRQVCLSKHTMKNESSDSFFFSKI